MTLEELANSLPNGFHDSGLKNLSINYDRGTVQLTVSLKVGDPDGPPEHRDDTRDAHIEITGLQVFAIDPPSAAAGYDLDSPGELWIADGYQTRSIPEFTKSMSRDLMESLPAEVWVHSFFVSEWNSYIHIAAKDCAMKWAGEPRPYRGRRQAFYPGETIEL
ncbi:MAG TPA: hypothetical protein VJQ59_03375 [Candidatus Sulfotelmatobacter sp.]|nr:hypothetical protein [Candidatus Sulfotelmatobacter sp.]